MRSITTLAMLLLLAAGASAGDFDFFPTVPSSAAPNCTSGDCAFPTAWSAANQTAYPDLGNLAGAGLLTIAAKDTYPVEPRFYFTPGAWCDTAGVNVTLDTIAASLPQVAATGGSNATAAGDGTFAGTSVSISSACQLAQVMYQVGNAGSVQTASPLGGGIYSVGLGMGLQDGLTCVEIDASYATSAFATQPPYVDLGVVQLDPFTHVTKRACIFKFTQQASAVIGFDMCTNGQFTVNISDVSPLPVNVTMNGAPAGPDGSAPLLRPLVKVWGSKVAELDGSAASSELDGSAALGANYVARYLPLPAGYAGEELAYPLDGGLQEGFYNLSSTVSLLTSYPDLVGLVGLNQIQQDDAPGADAGVTGLWEAATSMVHDGAVVGVQKASTPTTLSAISSSSHTSGQAVAAGEPITLTWKFVGVGTATCTHDGLPASNAPGGLCTSPLTVTAKSFAAGAAAHTVNVTFTDVCGRARAAQFTYTQAGVTAVSRPEILDADGNILVVTVRNSTTAGRGAAGASAPGVLTALLAGAALALAALL